MKSILIITSTRADYGIMAPLIRRIQNDPALELRLLVTGMHLSEMFGMTVNEIEADGIPIAARIPILPEGDTPQDVSQAMANALSRCSVYLAENRPDMAVLLGDRFEIFAIGAALANARIPIAHIHGGETTEGAVDECFRHGITKMSYIHFTSCETYRKRVIQLGELPERVFNVGAMGVENALNIDFLSLADIESELHFTLSGMPYAVVTFHPVTLEENTSMEQAQNLFKALSRATQLRYIITKSNADAGGRGINALIDEYAATHANCIALPSLGMRKYLSALKYASCVIGNSSSALIEAPTFGIPTVNIGDRQRGRIQAESVINCGANSEDIFHAIQQAMTPAFRERAHQAINPYGSGNTSERICEIIKDFVHRDKIELKKKFNDVVFLCNS